VKYAFLTLPGREFILRRNRRVNQDNLQGGPATPQILLKRRLLQFPEPVTPVIL
jgi:hypothetical protein